MTKKENIKRMYSNPISHTKSQTQDVRSRNNDKYLFDILEGIDTIAHKLKEITSKELETENRKPQSKSKKMKETKLTSQMQNSMPLGKNSVHNRSSSLKKENRGSQSARKRYKTPVSNNSTYGDRSQKWLKRVSTCSSSIDKGNKKLEESTIHSKNLHKNCPIKCIQALNQINTLKQLNEKLMKKNSQLQQKLLTESQDLNNLRMKMKKHKENQIILRIINENQKSKQFKSCCDQVENPQILIQINPSMTRFTNTIRSMTKISPVPKKKSEAETADRKKNLIDLSQHEITAPDLSEHIIKKQEKKDDKKPRKGPLEIKNLETEFDRLMEMSHYEKNKAKKKAIRNQMKTIANQLKMLRYFTQL